MHPKPRYKVVRPTVINRILSTAGREVDLLTWPTAVITGELEPVNEPAERIAGYLRRNSRDPWLPPSPYNPVTGTIFLPASTQPGNWHRSFPPAVAEGDAKPDMPHYEVRQIDARFGSRNVEQGTQIAFLGWNEPIFFLQPINEAAERVAAYYAEHRNHPQLPRAPWNLFDDSLFLPELPALVRKGAAILAPERPFAEMAAPRLRSARAAIDEAHGARERA